MPDMRVYLKPEYHEQFMNDINFHAAMIHLQRFPEGQERQDESLNVISRLCKEIESLKKQNTQLLMNKPQRIVIDFQ